MPPEFYPEWIKPEVKVEGLDDGFWNKIFNRTRSGIHVDPKYADVLAQQLIDWNNLPENVEVVGIEIFMKSFDFWTSDPFFYRDGQWEYVDRGKADDVPLPEDGFHDNLIIQLGWNGYREKWRKLDFSLRKQILHQSGDPNALVVELSFYDSETDTYYQTVIGIQNGIAKPVLVGYAPGSH